MALAPFLEAFRAKRSLRNEAVRLAASSLRRRGCRRPQAPGPVKALETVGTAIQRPRTAFSGPRCDGVPMARTASLAASPSSSGGMLRLPVIVSVCPCFRMPRPYVVMKGQTRLHERSHPGPTLEGFCGMEIPAGRPAKTHILDKPRQDKARWSHEGPSHTPIPQRRRAGCRVSHRPPRFPSVPRPRPPFSAPCRRTAHSRPAGRGW